MEVVIVGNGPITNDLTEVIDGADFVIRMNAIANHGGAAGSKTDAIALSNSGHRVTQFLRDRSTLERSPFSSAPEFLLVRNLAHHRELKRAARTLLERKIYGTYGPEFLLQSLGLRYPVDVVDYERSTALFLRLQSLTRTRFYMPSTGMLVIDYVTVRFGPAANILIAGFTHEGWDGHPWAAERQIVDGYCTVGLARRL